MWDLPRPGLEPVSPALAGGLLTTVPPGKPNHNSSDTRCVGCFSTPIYSSALQTPTGCPTIQFSSDPNYSELACRPYRTAQAKSQTICHLYFWLTIWLLIGDSHDTPSSGSIIWQNGSQNSGKHVTCYYWFIIRIQLKDSQMEEMHRARSYTELPRLLFRCPSQHLNVLINQEALQTPGLGIFMEV